MSDKYSYLSRLSSKNIRFYTEGVGILFLTTFRIVATRDIEHGQT